MRARWRGFRGGMCLPAACIPARKLWRAAACAWRRIWRGGKCGRCLSKVQRYPKVYDNLNSISHRGEFASACLDLWKRRAPFGIYNITNPGFVTTRHVVELVEKILRPERKFEFWRSDEEFYRVAAKT